MGLRHRRVRRAVLEIVCNNTSPFAMPGTLYHFTTSAHLPRILRSGELRPGVYPGQARDFIYVTDNENGDRTAAAAWTGPDYRSGKLRLVRFTVAVKDFEPWRTVLARYPEWTPALVERLERSARDRGQPTTGWHCRPDPLPLARVIAIHTRAYLGHRWEPFDPSSATVLAAPSLDRFGERLGIKLSGKIFWSTCYSNPRGYDAYKFEHPASAGR